MLFMNLYIFWLISKGHTGHNDFKQREGIIVEIQTKLPPSSSRQLLGLGLKSCQNAVQQTVRAKGKVFIMLI